MLPALCAILAPAAPLERAGPAAERSLPPEPDTIPAITARGRTLAVRPVVCGDAPLLADLLARLSARSAQLRFFRPLTGTEATWRQAKRVADADQQLHIALAATVLEDGVERAVALAELAHDQSDTAVAEIGIVVRDDYQQEGIGRMLAEFLVQLAILRGVGTLRADMLGGNKASRQLVRGLGLPYTAQTRRGETTALLKLPRA
jgi:acetyltransferase